MELYIILSLNRLGLTYSAFCYCAESKDDFVGNLTIPYDVNTCIYTFALN